MTTNTGTYDIDSLINSGLKTSAVDFGLDRLAEILTKDLAAWNATVLDMVADMCDVTTDRERASGASSGGDMQQVDEYGLASTQRIVPGGNVAFPLYLFQYNLGWTAKYLEIAPASALASQQLAAQKAHWREVVRQIKKAIYPSANFSVRDNLIDKVLLPVKRFVNADGDPIPDGPNGETFDGATHTHYNANNGWDATALTAAINSVIEHGHGGNVKVAINKADETAVRGLTGFVAYVDPRLAVPVYSATGIPTQRLDISRLDNRAIGIFGGAEVWVKSWILDNYPVIWDADAAEKPLAFRQRNQTSVQGLRIAFENADYPLYAKDMEAEFGIGVWTRTNGFVHYTGGASYVSPTIA